MKPGFSPAMPTPSVLLLVTIAILAGLKIVNTEAHFRLSRS